MNNDNEYLEYFNPKIIECKTTKNDLWHDVVRYLNELFNDIPDKKKR